MAPHEFVNGGGGRGEMCMEKELCSSGVCLCVGSAALI